MNQESLDQIARDIISRNIYLTLATSDESPWAAPVYYCVGERYEFYFSSQMSAIHTQHIIKNSRVAFAIFDSRAEEGSGNGIQGIGNAYLLTEHDEIEKALRWYRSTYVACTAADFDGSKPYRLFRIIPDKLFVLDPEHPVDKRVQVLIP
jgi:uncharacterized protein YhbP (UPF0306 family)